MDRDFTWIEAALALAFLILWGGTWAVIGYAIAALAGLMR